LSNINILYKKYEDKKWSGGVLGYIVYKRTYARLIEEENRTEEWHETIQRCISAIKKYNFKMSDDELISLYDYIFNLKCSISGRALWQLGTKIVDKFMGDSLLNCWFTKLSTIEDFCFGMQELMLGGGVGISVRKEDVYQLPKIKENIFVNREDVKDADFIVPDKREGWVELLRKTLEAYMNSGKSFTYSLALIRSRGALIKGFGGKSAGPEELHKGIQNICAVLKNRESKRLRSIDVLDIFNIIGQIVVSGNVRRSAILAIGDPDDILFLRAKRWDLGNIPSWRAMSNNSIAADDYDETMPEFWSGYHGNGEPYGLVNIKLAKAVGKLGRKKRDNSIEGFNPCGEIALAHRENCNLTEIFLPKIKSKEELKEIAILLYKYSKNVANMKFIHEETERIVHKNNRLGLSVTGICESTQEQLSWLDEISDYIEEFDKEYSKQNEWNESVRIFTVKPSGTLSILPGITPGIHPAYSEYYIRRVRMAADDDLVELCRNAGLKMEYEMQLDGNINRNTIVIEFPVKSGQDAILAKNVTAVDQLELLKKMQTVWSDNAVSCTVYYKKEEIDDIKNWLKENYKNNVKSVSFLLHSEHGFKQAPYEEITKEQYEDTIKSIDFEKLYKKSTALSELRDTLECETGLCPIK